MAMKIAIIKRAITLVMTLIIATYITVVVANLGGLIDEIIKGQIWEDLVTRLARSPEFSMLTPEEQDRILKQRFEAAIKARGLDQPFIVRTFIYLKDALTLNLGRALFMTSSAGSRSVRAIILERLPQTLLLFTTGTITSCFLGLILGLWIARSPGTLKDKFISMFAIVTQTLPAWFIGIIFILLFAYYFRLTPFGGMVSVPPPSDPFNYALDVLRHLALPLFTWTFTYFGYWAYLTRNMVIQISEEDYILTAKAKGLPESLIIRRHVLRPALPPIITQMAIAIIFSLQGAIITEQVFNWPGLGRILLTAIMTYDAPVVIGVVVIFAYLLVITVFILDILYAILDPRIKIGG